MQFSDSIFASRFNLAKQDLESFLGEALSQGGDYADLYFEYLLTSSISLDESMVKSASQGVSMGVGVRVIAGERTGYAYSDDLAPEKIRKAARVAAHKPLALVYQYTHAAPTPPWQALDSTPIGPRR